MNYVIGIDGGGTKTRALLATPDGDILAEANTGPSNPQIVGFDRAAHSIFNLVRECCGKISQPVKLVKSVVAGIGGIGRSEDKSQLIEALKSVSIYTKNIQLEHDARIALEAALPWRPGIVLISGTGSIAFYRTKDNLFLRSGGWGRVLGDDGSGYDLSREALRAVMLAYEERGKTTVLTDKVLKFFNIGMPDHLISAIKRINGDIAPIAPLILESAQENDTVALEILENGANELVMLIQTLINQHAPEGKITLAFEGGLLDKDNVYSSLVRRKLKEKFPSLYVQKPKFPPVYGALILAINKYNQEIVHA